MRRFGALPLHPLSAGLVRRRLHERGGSLAWPIFRWCADYVPGSRQHDVAEPATGVRTRRAEGSRSGTRLRRGFGMRRVDGAGDRLPRQLRVLRGLVATRRRCAPRTCSVATSCSRRTAQMTEVAGLRAADAEVRVVAHVEPDPRSSASVSTTIVPPGRKGDGGRRGDRRGSRLRDTRTGRQREGAPKPVTLAAARGPR